MIDIDRIKKEVLRLNQEAIQQAKVADEQGEKEIAAMWHGKANAYDNIYTSICYMQEEPVSEDLQAEIDMLSVRHQNYLGISQVIHGKYKNKENLDMINELRATIESYERGTTFFADSLTGYGSIAEVTEALDQLCKEEIIIRITDGFYCYPELLNRFGMKFQKPIINEVIWDVAQHRGVRLAPTAAYSENALMLSTQVQMRYVYLTDAESQEWKFYDTITVNLRQFTDFDVFSFRSDLMQMIVISLHHITQKWVTDMELGIIRKYLIHVTEEDFQHDLALSPEWIRNALLPMK